MWYSTRLGTIFGRAKFEFTFNFRMTQKYFLNVKIKFQEVLILFLLRCSISKLKTRNTRSAEHRLIWSGISQMFYKIWMPLSIFTKYFSPILSKVCEKWIKNSNCYKIFAWSSDNCISSTPEYYFVSIENLILNYQSLHESEQKRHVFAKLKTLWSLINFSKTQIPTA